MNGYSVYVNECRKIGKLCICHIYASHTSMDLNGNASICKLPWETIFGGYQLVVSVTARNTASGATCQIPILLLPNGLITPLNSCQGYQEIRGVFAYFSK